MWESDYTWRGYLYFAESVGYIDYAISHEYKACCTSGFIAIWV